MKKAKKTKKKPTAAPKAAAVSAKGGGEASRKPTKRRKTATKVGVKDRTSGMVATVSQFLREVRVELSKVTWPTRRETIASTSVVLVIVILIGIFLGLVDLGLSRLMRIVLS